MRTCFGEHYPHQNKNPDECPSRRPITFVDIPDVTDPGHEEFHEEHGTIIEMSKDAAGETTGDDRDETRYRIELNCGEIADFRWRELRPPIK